MPTAIVELIAIELAKHEGVAPEDLNLAIGDYIDCDAIRRLHSSSTLWSLQFHIPGYDVTVNQDGLVNVSSR